jgi:hypothetical protein
MTVTNALYVFWAAAKYCGMSVESRDSLIIRGDRCEAIALQTHFHGYQVT